MTTPLFGSQPTGFTPLIKKTATLTGHPGAKGCQDVNGTMVDKSSLKPDAFADDANTGDTLELTTVPKSE